jgi:hypothetical protein
MITYYVDEFFQNVTRFIALRNLRGSHFKENIAILFIEIIRDFEIEDLFRYLVTDNAKSNNTYIEFLLSRLISDLTATKDLISASAAEVIFSISLPMPSSTVTILNLSKLKFSLTQR